MAAAPVFGSPPKYANSGFFFAPTAFRQRPRRLARHPGIVLIETHEHDPYGQALSKLQRRHDRDLQDVCSMLRTKLIARDRLREMFTLIKPQLIRYPAIDPASFEAAVLEFCDDNA
jgi:hypothetical protein